MAGTIVVRETATVIGGTPVETEIVTEDDAIAAAGALAIHPDPATMAKTRHIARQEVTRVGAEAGAVIPADTHVVTEVEMAITIAEAEAAVLDHVRPTVTIGPEATTVGIAMTEATAAVMTTEPLAVMEEIVRLAMPPHHP
jgi:hypothetical protein